MKGKLRLTILGASVAALFLLVFLVGCDLDGVSVDNAAPDDSSPSAGELHNLVLEKIYDACDDPGLSKTEKIHRTVAAVEDFAIEYDVVPPTAEEVELYIDRGRKMARQALIDPSIPGATIFSGEDLVWWERFTAEACHPDARSVYKAHCALYGPPRKGSALDYAADIWVHSAEFWFARHGDDWNGEDPGKLQDPQSQLLRFFVVLIVDGVAGGTSGASAGPIVGGIVGGLASHGVDELIWGDDGI